MAGRPVSRVGWGLDKVGAWLRRLFQGREEGEVREMTWKSKTEAIYRKAKSGSLRVMLSLKLSLLPAELKCVKSEPS